MSKRSINEQPRLPSAPLAEILKTRFPAARPEAMYDNPALEKHGMSQYVYGRRTEMTAITADKMAGKLGMHPSEIWPEWDTLPLKEDLQMHGLTRQEMADATGMPLGTIRSWRHGGVYSNVNEWVAECLGLTSAQA